MESLKVAKPKSPKRSKLNGQPSFARRLFNRTFFMVLGAGVLAAAQAAGLTEWGAAQVRAGKRAMAGN